jgi:exonuclease III
MCLNNSGRHTAATLSLLTFNTNRRADLGGLPGLLRDCHPDLVFLQEVAVSPTALSAAVAGMGYTVWRSDLAQPRRCIAVLARRPAAVTEVVPGYAQHVEVLGLHFLHFHSPAGTNTASRTEREQFFQARKQFISSLPIAPILIGDFNCVINPFDVQQGPEPFDAWKLSPALRSLITSFAYVDVFRQLYPNTVQFSFFRRSFLSSRLDRVYVPHLFATSCTIARYIPTVSDHSAFYTVFDAAALGLRLE